jgi:hypothetical protein
MRFERMSIVNMPLSSLLFWAIDSGECDDMIRRPAGGNLADF